MDRSAYITTARRLAALGLLLTTSNLTQPAHADAGASPGLYDGSLVPLSDTFTLHSKRGSKKTIWLNFKGGPVYTSSMSLPRMASPFDEDGKPATFSDNELRTIQYIWQRVAEDYAPLDVDVTTETVAPEALDRSSVKDDIFGMQAVFTNHKGLFNTIGAGISSGGSFDKVNNVLPAFIFEDETEAFYADVASHEVGHTLGLGHDGKGNIELWTGTFDGWGPIMGGLGGALTQFSKGEYDGATNKEDDFAVMQQHGLALRTDEVGNTPDTSVPLRAGAPYRGIIEKAGDTDMFLINAGAGPFTAHVTPAARGPNADLVLTLLDGNGNVVATSNPADVLDASLNLQFPAAGTYFLAVKGTGKGNPRTDGYSDYGSVGVYTLAANFPAMPAKLAPAASLKATPASGEAPLIVTLDGSRSKSSARVRFWYWDFGDGTSDKTGSLKTARKTYATPGSYVVTLRVVDGRGSSNIKKTTINVSERLTPMAASSVSVSVSPFKRGLTSFASGTVTVVDESGKPLPGAQVNMSWSGPFSANFNKDWSVPTAANGTVSVFSPPLSITAPGCYQLIVTGVSLDHYIYNAPRTPPAATKCN